MPRANNDPAVIQNRDALLAAHPWIEIDALMGTVQRLLNENASVATRRRKFIQLIDRTSAALVEHGACRNGCSHCCHIATSLYSHEAEAIGRHIGRAPVKLPARHPGEVRDQSRANYTSVPCPFLTAGRCSIYEVRPYSCRAHHSLNGTPDQCDTVRFPSNESNVGSYNLQALDFGYAWLAMQAKDLTVGDIREFFPAENA